MVCGNAMVYSERCTVYIAQRVFVTLYLYKCITLFKVRHSHATYFKHTRYPQAYIDQRTVYSGSIAQFTRYIRQSRLYRLSKHELQLECVNHIHFKNPMYSVHCIMDSVMCTMHSNTVHCLFGRRVYSVQFTSV